MSYPPSSVAPWKWKVEIPRSVMPSDIDCAQSCIGYISKCDSVECGLGFPHALHDVPAEVYSFAELEVWFGVTCLPPSKLSTHELVA